jgi:hypothetical protein
LVREISQLGFVEVKLLPIHVTELAVLFQVLKSIIK